jgi:hypothetical protein
VTEPPRSLARGLARLTLRRLGALAALCALAGGGCSSGDDDTLPPLPIEGGTAAPAPTPFVTLGAPSTTSTTLAPAPAATTTTTTVVTATTSAAAAAGDWDGARFDLGVITALTKVGALEGISLDRWSYTSPDGRLLDASSFDAEPIVAWWQASPFVNVNPRTRTFVLAPDVQVQLVDPAGRATACTDPPPASPPAPTRTPATVAALSDPANTGTVAILTYGPTGQVTKIRLTRGC